MDASNTHSLREERTSTAGRFSSSLTQAKLFFFAAAGFSFLLSVYLWFTGDHERGMFVGLWVPSICSAGTLLLAGRSHE